MSNEVRFIGVGAVKSGSSWMASLLEQHPEVSMSSRKEIAYFNKFNFNGTKNNSTDFGLNYYLKFWQKSEAVKGEVSPQYLFDPSAAKRIKEAFPDVHILMILRNPKDVLYSHFLYERGFNQNIPKNTSFIDALKSYPYLIESACFSKQIKRYLAVFPSSQLHIYFLNEALKNPQEFSKKLYTNIQLTNINFKPDYSSVNESKQVRSTFINALIRFPSQVKTRLENSIFSRLVETTKSSNLFISIVKYRNNLLDRNVQALVKPKLTEPELAYISPIVAKEIEDLEVLLKLDLQAWKAS
jgi:hypothetical protein